VPPALAFIDDIVRRPERPPASRAPFPVYNINSYEDVERLIRPRRVQGTAGENWVAISGGMDAPNIYNLANFLRANPRRAPCWTVESSMRNVLRSNMMGLAMGLHVPLRHRGQHLEPVAHREDVRSSRSSNWCACPREFGREVANGRKRARFLKIRRLLRHRRGNPGRPNGFRANPKAPASYTAQVGNEHAVLPATQAPDDGLSLSRARPGFAFAMTFGLMLFDYIDRQVIVLALFRTSKSEWNLSDKQLGSLVSIISIGGGDRRDPVALMADRVSR